AAPSRVANALGSIPAVDLAVAYGVRDGAHDVVVAAVTALPGCELTQDDLESAVRALRPEERPQYVREVDDIPVTTWSRPRLQPLRDAGIPGPGALGRTWQLIVDCGT